MRYPTIKLLFIALVLILTSMGRSKGQSVSLEMATSPNIDFDFNTINKYITGIIFMNACELDITVQGVQWDLYVGATTSNTGYWDVSTQYSSYGEDPPIDILELRFRNSANTSQIPGFFQVRDIGSPVYIIGTNSAPDVAVNCPNQGTNQPGDYHNSPSCYKFNVDMKITPGLNPVYKAGLYTMRIDYVLVEDL